MSTPLTKDQGFAELLSDVSLTITLEAFPDSKKHQRKADMALLALQVNIMEVLDRMKPELDRQKISVNLYKPVP